MDLEAYLKERRTLIEETLERCIPSADTFPQILYQAMRYSLFAGGKRLRPILVLASYEALKDNSSEILTIAAAIELIHAYSLIHDDLPSMDNDDFRRGQLTCHKVFGEGIAILTGDALLTMAFTMMSDHSLSKKVRSEIIVSVIKETGTAAGSFGMVGGQVMDIQAVGKKIELPLLDYIHTHKTGALIRASVRVGAILAEADEKQMDALTGYGDNIGLAYQIVDDILDIEEEKEKSNNNTYPFFVGVSTAKQRAKDLIKNAITSLEDFDEKADPLREIAKYIVARSS